MLGEDWTNEWQPDRGGSLEGPSVAEGEEGREAGAAETGRQGCV